MEGGKGKTYTGYGLRVGEEELLGDHLLLVRWKVLASSP